MTHRGKSSFTTSKNKLFNWLKNGLRILLLIIFFHWILWITSYANCTNYQEAISEKNFSDEAKKLTNHNAATDKYQCFTGWFNEKKEKNIEQIEEDILDQIEKKKGLVRDEKIRIWKQEKLPELVKLNGEIENLQKKENPSQAEKEEITKKKGEYNQKLATAKKETIENIKKQLDKNELNITELDDNKIWGQKMWHDPLKFFLVEPLNQSSKLLGLHNRLFLEIIFKLVIVEIILFLICYNTEKFWENAEKARDLHLSVEERDQLNEEASSLFKYVIFNFCMTVLFNFFLFFHPAFFDRTSSLFQSGTTWKTAWYVWVLPLFISLLLSSISTEFMSRGRLLTKQELKDYVVKNWVVSLVFALIMLLFMWWVGMSSIGSYLLSSLAGLVKFAISIVRVKIFGHRERFPTRRGGTHIPRTTYGYGPRRHN